MTYTGTGRCMAEAGVLNGIAVVPVALFSTASLTAFLTVFLTASLTLPEPLRASENQYREEGLALAKLYETESTVEEGVRQFNPSGALDEYLAYAAIHNPGLRAAYYGWVSQLGRAGYVGAAPDPMLSFSYFIENVETRVGPQERRVGLRQLIPWFGSLGAKKDVALEGANAAYQKYRSLKLALFYRVKSAYYDYYYLHRNIRLTSDNIELLKLWESVARTKYKAGIRKYPDVLKAQVELGLLSDKLETLRAQIEPVSARLRAELNLPPEVSLPAPTDVELFEAELSRDTVLALARENNPDVEALLHNVKKQSSAVSLAAKRSYPNLTLGADYIFTGEAINPALDGSGKDPLMVGVGVNLPLWFGKNRARKDEARAGLRRAEYELQDRSNQILRVVEQALFRHDDALRKIRLYRDGLVPKAQQSLNASYTAYEAGESDFLTVLDAQRLLLDFQLKYDFAVAQLGAATAELAMLTGRE